MMACAPFVSAGEEHEVKLIEAANVCTEADSKLQLYHGRESDASVAILCVLPPILMLQTP